MKERRLIDADAMQRQAFEDNFAGRISDGMLFAVNWLLERAPTIDAEPHWIPCSERLPENADEVLVTYIVNGNKKRRFVETSTYYDNEEEGFWSSPWDEYRVPNTKIEVLAWMPLPKPFKAYKTR